MKDTIIECARAGGQVLGEHFHKIHSISKKEDQSNIVTEVDYLSEKRIVSIIRSRFPEDSIIGEENGFRRGTSETLWVIDPLDGTSNYACNIPWFGILIAVFIQKEPVAGAMYLPSEDVLYFAQRGLGAFRNGEKISVSSEVSLSKILCAYSLDASNEPVAFLPKLVKAVRNLRSTNCLVDFCFTADGRFGTCINQNTKIWDIASPAIILREAGGVLTLLDGSKIQYDLTPYGYNKSYAVLGGAQPLHQQILQLNCKEYET